jgi:hypothetical protein
MTGLSTHKRHLNGSTSAPSGDTVGGAGASAHAAENLAAALDIAADGIPIFPARVDFNKQTNRWDKRPRVKNWQANATTNQEQIRNWWRDFPDALPGIELGRAGCVVIDADRHGGPDGVALFGELVAANGGLPAHSQTNTPGDGEHHIFGQPKGERFGNGRGALPDGIDVRGDGGWIVAPGAVRPDGRGWEPAPGSPSLADTPPLAAWLARIIRTKPERRPVFSNPNNLGEVRRLTSSATREVAYARQTLDNLAGEFSRMPAQTGRNNALNGSGYRMGRMVAREWIDRADVVDALWTASVANGLVKDDGADKVEDTLTRALAAGIEQPHEDLLQRPSVGRNGNEDWDGGTEFDTSGKARPNEPALNATSPDHDLTEMNAKYAVVKVGGKTRVVSMEENLTYPGCKVPVYSSFADFRAFHANPKRTLISEAGNERKVGIGRWWIGHEKRRQYDGIVYAPGASAEATLGKLNLWAGFGCASIKGDCDQYLAHLHENVCAKLEEHSEYLLNWMAYAVQHPGRQGEVAVVMRGKEGVGKGVLAKEFGRLFGSHYRHISQAGHLTGHFNAHLQQCSVLFADEAFFAGDRSHESILKALITEETLMIEPKGVDPFPVRNCLHLIISSNNEWVIPAGADARRYFVVTVSDARKQNHSYFAAIARQMDAGGREALLAHLLKRDLSRFDVRRVPHSDALADQKAHSRRGVDRVVELLAHSGILPAAHAQHPNVAVTSGEESGNGFYPKARSLAPDLKYDSSIVISAALKKDWGCESWKSGYERGIKFPPLTELRKAFDEKHGKQAWPTYGDMPARGWGDM